MRPPALHLGHELATLAATCLTAGCVYTLAPAIPPELARSNPALLGEWVNDEGDRAVVTAGEGGDYRVAYSDSDGEPVELCARLGELGGRTVLEVTRVCMSADDDWPVGRLQVFLELGEDRLTLALLDTDSARAALQSGALLLPHMTSMERNENVLLGGSSEEVAEALESYVARPGVMGSPDVWRRVRED
ncbi:MAG TPA: hypothetical protein VK849_04095 [Longimicrobiales bacterium]|nr:hypothetical protein [Longimicrobiales bacterium]